MADNVLTPMQRKWLDRIKLASKPGFSMYAGEREDFIPHKVLRQLEQSGWVDRVIPTNPVHKERIVINDHGLAALEAK